LWPYYSRWKKDNVTESIPTYGRNLFLREQMQMKRRTEWLQKEISVWKEKLLEQEEDIVPLTISNSVSLRMKNKFRRGLASPKTLKKIIFPPPPPLPDSPKHQPPVVL